MKTLFLFLASLPLLALQNGDFNGSNFLSLTGPNVSATNYRLEGRISGFGILGTPQGIMGNNDFGGPHCYLVAGSITLRCRDFSGAGDTVSISLTGRTDIRFRFQRFYSTGVRLLEVWNSDGTGYASDSITNAVSAIGFNVTQNIGSYYGAGSECTCSIGFARWWSTTLAAESSAPPDILLLGYADLIDLELEGNTNDSSPYAATVTTTGGAISYSTTITYPPAAVITNSGAARAGASYDLDGDSSSNLTTDQPLTYFWQSPSWSVYAPVFTSRTTSTTNVIVTTAQTATIRLRVTDGIGQTGTSDISLGSVATDNNSVVIFSDTNVENIVGAALRSGASNWTWFDNTEIAVADAIIATRPAFQGNTVLDGTITVTASSSTITGVGTNFSTQFACDGSENIVIHYPIDGGGGATGRRAYVVTGCVGADTMSIYPDYDASASGSGVQFGKISIANNGQWVNQSNNWNYYDAAAALYQLYYRTGNTTYRTQARELADAWFQYPIDGCRAWEYTQGFWQIPPRMMSLKGLMLRANDGRPEIWDQLMNCVSLPYTNLLFNYYAFQPGQNIAEIREQGYVLLATQLAAMLHPDGPTRATWQTNANLGTSYFMNNQTAYGGWTFSLGANQNYYGSGNFPWQGFALMQALRLNYVVTENAAVATSLKNYVDYIIAEGIDATNDGGYYEDTYFTWCPDYPAERSGTVTATNGSTTVTGSTTAFQSQYACNGTDTIAIQDSSGFRRGYTVVSCSSQTDMVIGATYGGSTEGGLRILKYDGVATTPPSACHVSYGTTDEAKSAARTLNNGLHWGFGWAGLNYGGSYISTGDVLFGQNLGLDGLDNDGVVGHFGDAVSGGTAPQYLAATYLSKEYGFVSGAASSPSYLAWRIGGVAPLVTTSLTVQAKRASISGTAKLRINITQPSGVVTTNTCAADTCTVSGLDTRQGTRGLLQIQYLTAGDVVLSTGRQQPVTIQ